MNKYLTFPGLQPVYLGDIDFLQESVRSAFLMLLRGLTGQDNPRCIIAEATPEKDGVICFDGEIMPLKYFAGAVSGSLVYKIETTYSGERTFMNGETQKCYETRYAVGAAGGISDPDKASGFAKLQDLLVRAVKINEAPGWSVYNTDSVSFRYARSVVAGMYHIAGRFGIIDNCTLTNIIEDIGVDLPAGFWYFPITVKSNGILKCVPAKLTVVYDDAAGYNKATISVNQTNFTMDDEGSFSLTLMK